MTDVAELGLRVESKSVQRGSRELEKLRRSAGQAERAVDELGDEARRTGRQIEQSNKRASNSYAAIGAAAAAARGPIGSLATMAGTGLGFGLATRAIMSFGDRMGNVQAISGATGAELKALRDVAKDMGASTEFSASQAAEGLQFLSMAGLDARQSISALPAALDLATAANLELGRSADIVSNIMTAFGISADGVRGAADVLAATAAKSNTSVNQLGEAMKFVGTVAANFGVPVADAAAAVGTLGNAGIQASMAGTGLRRVLSGLANPTGQAEKELSRLGLTVEELNPETNSLVELVNKLGDAGIDAASALEIFGQRGGPALLALVENRSGLEGLTDDLRSVDGAVADMAGIMRNDLRGDLQMVASAAEAVAVEFGDAGLTGTLRGFAQNTAGALRSVADNADTAYQAMRDLWTVVTAPARVAGAMFSELGAEILNALGPSMAQAVQGSFVSLLEALRGTAAAIEQAFSNLPRVFHDLSLNIARNFLMGIEDLVRGTVNAILSMNRQINSLLEGSFLDSLAVLPGTAGARMREALAPGFMADTVPESSGAASAVGDAFSSAVSEMRQSDEGSGLSGNNGSDAANSTNSVTKATERLKEEIKQTGSAYEQITQGARSFIAQQRLEQAAMGRSTKAAERLRAEYDLFNQAMQAGIELTPSQIAELRGLAGAMGEAAAKTEEMDQSLQAANDNLDFARSSTRGFLGDIVNGFKEGKSAVEAFADALSNLADRLINRGLDMLIDAIFPDSVSSGGSGGGGFNVASLFSGGGGGGSVGAPANDNAMAKSAAASVASSAASAASSAATQAAQQVAAKAAPMVETSLGGAFDGLEASFASNLRKMMNDAAAAGHDISINSGFRSRERQEQLWAGALQKYGDPEIADNWVARPGSSLHNFGLAADLGYSSDAARRFAHQNAGNYGLNFRMGHEPWHIEPQNGIAMRNQLRDAGGSLGAPQSGNFGAFDAAQQQAQQHQQLSQALREQIAATNEATQVEQTAVQTTERSNTAERSSVATTDQIRAAYQRQQQEMRNLGSTSDRTTQQIQQMGNKAGSVATENPFGNAGQALEGAAKDMEGSATSFSGMFGKILQQIIGGIGGMVGGGGGGGGLVGSLISGVFSLFGAANGAAFGPNGVMAFADGGVVSRPTAFPMRGGKTGVMGEAGEEAILPLKRNREGRLGVEADTGRSESGGKATVVVSLDPALKSEMKSEMRGIAVEVVKGGLAEYDRKQAPRTAERIRKDPRKVG